MKKIDDLSILQLHAAENSDILFETLYEIWRSYVYFVVPGGFQFLIKMDHLRYLNMLTTIMEEKSSPSSTLSTNRTVHGISQCDFLLAEAPVA
jgi:hypothetical protein